MASLEGIYNFIEDVNEQLEVSTARVVPILEGRKRYLNVWFKCINRHITLEELQKLKEIAKNYGEVVEVGVYLTTECDVSRLDVLVKFRIKGDGNG